MNDLFDQFAHDAWRENEDSTAYPVIDVDSESTGFCELIAEAGRLAKYIGLSGDEFRGVLEELDSHICLYQGEVSAMGASRIDVLSYPGDGFLEMLSALRTGDRDVFVAFCAAHGGSFQ